MSGAFGSDGFRRFRARAVLEGDITLSGPSFGRATFVAGDAFSLPKGLPLAWSQKGDVRKCFVVFNPPAEVPAKL